MVDISNLRDVFNIVRYGSGNNEIDKLVKNYFTNKDERYLQITKFHYLALSSRRGTMNLFNMNLKEYRDTRTKIVEDVRQIVFKYYNLREKKFKKNTKVIDLLNRL